MNTRRESGSVEYDDPVPLIELLAGFLLAAPDRGRPGADGLTVEDAVLADYPAALACGHVPGPDELIRRYPELADAVAAFFIRCGCPPTEGR